MSLNKFHVKLSVLLFWHWTDIRSDSSFVWIPASV